VRKADTAGAGRAGGVMGPRKSFPTVRKFQTSRRRDARRTDHMPTSSNAATMNTAIWFDTAGAGLAVAHTPPLQSVLAHCVLAVQGSPSLRLWGVGVTVAVGVVVPVGVTVDVEVDVGVAVGGTHSPNWQKPMLQAAPGTKSIRQRPPIQVRHSPHAGKQPPPKPPALARGVASRSTTSTTSPMRVMGAVIRKTAVQIKGDSGKQRRQHHGEQPPDDGGCRRRAASHFLRLPRVAAGWRRGRSQ
jgi:hypothetical protein